MASAEPVLVRSHKISNVESGWFASLSTSGKKKGITVPHFTTLEKLALSDTETFLIGGNKKIRVIVTDKHKLKYQSCIHPGEQLAVAAIFSGQVKVKNKGILKASKWLEQKFLSCRSEDGREFIIPLKEEGMFYPIRRRQPSNTNRVMTLQEILKTHKLPCVVKLVFGGVPNTPCAFTGVLQFNSTYTEESVISSTILNFKNILLEVPHDKVLKYRIARVDTVLLTNKGYKSALQLCEEKATAYMKNMKVCHRYSDDALCESNSNTCQELRNSVAEFNRTYMYQQLRSSNITTNSTRYHAIAKATTNENQYSQLPDVGGDNTHDRTRDCNEFSPDGASGVSRKAESYSKASICDSFVSLATSASREGQNYKPPIPPKTKRFPILTSLSHTYDEITHPPRPLEAENVYGNVGESYGDQVHDENAFGSSCDDEIYENIGNLKKVSVASSDVLPDTLIGDEGAGIYCNTEMIEEAKQEHVNNNVVVSAREPLSDNDNQAQPSRRKSSVKDTSRDSGIGEENVPIAKLSIHGLAAELRKLKINRKVVAELTAMNIDGSFLSTCDDHLLKEAAPSITRIDLQKILMFKGGWRPGNN